jgi:hypothetical protein
MRMPSSAGVHTHPQSRTTSYRSLTVGLVRPSMSGTTPICCSTSLVRRWILLPMGSSTLSTTWSRWTQNLRKGQRRSPTLSNNFCSYRSRHDPHLLTTRGYMPCLTSTRSRSHCCRMQRDKFHVDWVRLACNLIACNHICDPGRENKVLVSILFLILGFHFDHLYK